MQCKRCGGSVEQMSLCDDERKTVCVAYFYRPIHIFAEKLQWKLKIANFYIHLLTLIKIYAQILLFANI